MTPRFDRRLIPEAPDLHFESELWQAGCHYIAGIDEAGRGALLGPVAAGAIIFPNKPGLVKELAGVRDSKQMDAKSRAFWAEMLTCRCLAWGVGFASAAEIDGIGIVAATRLAMNRAVRNLSVQPDHLLVDYLRLPEFSTPQTALVKGDARSLSIAAASILAKTRRDALLLELDAQYPGYSLAQHKGYATAAHLRALQRLGPTPIHRRTFRPINGYTNRPQLNIDKHR